MFITAMYYRYGKLQMTLKIIQSLYRNMTATLASIKTKLKIVGILLDADSCKHGNFGFYKNSSNNDIIVSLQVMPQASRSS